MTQPSLNPPKAGAHAPKVVLLPDALFFTRAISMAPAATPAEAATQAELGLEALSPFSPAQLYHGFFWVPGAERALVFAAYRRRFTREQVEAWSGAELVLPAFAALLGGDASPATTLLVTSADGLTAIHWDKGAVPAAVLFRPLPPEVTDEERTRVRDELLRAAGGSREVIELGAPPEAEAALGSEDEFVFRAESRVSRLPAVLAATMDVRDKAELAALRRARARRDALARISRLRGGDRPDRAGLGGHVRRRLLAEGPRDQGRGPATGRGPDHDPAEPGHPHQ